MISWLILIYSLGLTVKFLLLSALFDGNYQRSDWQCPTPSFFSCPSFFLRVTSLSPTPRALCFSLPPFAIRILELRGFDSSARSVWCEPNFFLPRRDLDRLHRLIALCVTLQRGVIVTPKNIIKNWSRNFDIIDNNAPVKGNPDPPHPGICGALSPYSPFHG